MKLFVQLLSDKDITIAEKTEAMFVLMKMLLLFLMERQTDQKEEEYLDLFLAN